MNTWRIVRFLGVTLASLVMLAAASGAQTTWYVDDDGTPPGVGTLEEPYASIQYAIDQVTTLDGDTVLVLPGIYYEQIDFLGKNIVLRSRDGRDVTTIDAGYTDRVITCDKGEGPAAVIDGFRIMHGNPVLSVIGNYGGGILCKDSSPTIRNNLLEFNWGSGAGIYCWKSDSLIEGNLIQHNGNAHADGTYDDQARNCTYGGGIEVDGGTPIIRNNAILANYGNPSSGGGGVSIRTRTGHWSSAQVLDNSIVGNIAYQGGGISNFSPNVTIQGNNIANNIAGGSAGGIRDFGGARIIGNTVVNNSAIGAGGVQIDPTALAHVVDNTISGNAATAGKGGGLSIGSSIGGIVSGNTITDNWAYHHGGGILFGGSGVLITGNSILRNAAGYGGGIAVRPGYYAVFSGNVIAENSAGTEGGGIWVGYRNSHATFVNETIYGNEAVATGGAVYLEYGLVPTSFVNCVAWGNTTTSGPDWSVAQNDPGLEHSITYCDIEGASGESWFGTGCIDQDPEFLDPANGDFHLVSTSPCINAGDSSSVPPDSGDLDGDGDVAEALPFDFEGDPRIEGTVDMGADEYAGPPPNDLPIAAAGSDQTQHLGTLVTMDGSASSDPDGHYPLAYSWTFVTLPTGSIATLSDPLAMNPTFVVDKLDDFVLELVVTDALGAQSTADAVIISTYNAPPTADAGPDQAVIEIGTLVELDGTQSYDIDDNDGMTFAWTMITWPPLSTATLSDPSSDRPTFEADANGSYTVRLVVTDAWGAESDPDDVVVSFTNLKPVAAAGNNQSVLVGDAVYLDGSGSSDANYDPLSFLWSIVSKPSDSTAELSDPAAAAPVLVVDKPGEYVVGLVVNDGLIDSDSSNLTILARVDATVVSTQLDDGMDELNGLDAIHYKNKKLKKALTGKMNAVFKMIDDGLYWDAIDKLENDILKKMDGCAVSGDPDKNDWLTTDQGQNAVYPLIEEARDLLLILLTQ